LAALPEKAAKFLGGLEKILPAEDFVHGGKSPSLGDLAIFDAVCSPFPGLEALKVDLTPYPKVNAVVAKAKAFPAIKTYFKDETPAASDLELVYFDGPGRGQLTRLVLTAGGIDFKDTRLDFASFGEKKADPNFIANQRFGSMPLLKHDGMVLAQSSAIATYAAELALGAANLTATQQATDQMILATYADLQSAMYGCLFGDDAAKAAGLAALPEKAAKFLGGLEKILPAENFVHGGDSPSLGDLAIFDAVCSPFPGLEALKVDLTSYPKVNAVVAKVKAFPAIAAYFEKK